CLGCARLARTRRPARISQPLVVRFVPLCGTICSQRRPLQKHPRNLCWQRINSDFREGISMYRLSARQILLIALISGLFAAGVVVILDRISNRYQPSEAALSNTPPAGISDPAAVTD